MSQADSEFRTWPKAIFFVCQRQRTLPQFRRLRLARRPSTCQGILDGSAWETPDARNLRNHASGNRVNPRVTVDGKTLKLGKRNDLFVMLKEDPKNKATDEGWVYGVIDSESYKIKAAGAVASCVACHEGENDRLFRDGVIDWNAEARKALRRRQ